MRGGAQEGDRRWPQASRSSAIEAPPNKETATTEKELELLQVVWGMWDEWEAKMTGWKYGKFKEIDVTAIENDAAQVGKRLYKLSKEVKQWKVLDTLREKVEGMKKLMPLIMDLRNPAMRDRHWKGLMEEVGPRSTRTRPHAHIHISPPHPLPFPPAVGQPSTRTATTLIWRSCCSWDWRTIPKPSRPLAGGRQGAAIEDALVKIEAQETCRWTWRSMTSKLESADDLYCPQDNSVALSTTKARATPPPSSCRSIAGRRRSRLGDGEMLMGVQRKWMYL